MIGKPRLRLGSTALERSLLRSWESEQPSLQAREKALALVAGAAAVGAAAQAATAATTAAKSGVALGWFAAGKWVLLATLIAGSATAVGVELSSPAPEARAPLSAALPEKRAKTPPPLATAAPRGAAEEPLATGSSETPAEQLSARLPPPPPRASDPPRAVPKPSTSAATPPSASSTPPPAADRLATEVALVDGARKAVLARNPGEALRLLDRYDRECPRGMLGQEALFLRIEALVQQGNRAAAKATAARFVATYPDSALLARIRALLGDDAP